MIVASSFNTSLLRYQRSWGLWVLLLIAPVAARFWIPSKEATSAVIAVNGLAPILTSAMLGVSLGIVVSMLLLPIAFIYLRSNVTRRQPWQIEDVTVGSRIAIALGRFAADCAVFGGVLFGMTIAGWFIGWLMIPSSEVDSAAIAVTLWVIAAPALMGVAGLRILFDAMRFTRGAWGEALFFVLWLASIIAPIAAAQNGNSIAGNMADFTGFVAPLTSALPHGVDADIAIGASAVGKGRIALDVMSGIMSDGYIASRMAWSVIAVFIAVLAGLIHSPHKPAQPRRNTGRVARLLDVGPPPPVNPAAPPARQVGLGWIYLVLAEARLIIRGRLFLAAALAITLAGFVLAFRTIISPALLLLLIFGATAHAGRSEQRLLLALTGTTAVQPVYRRAAFLCAGIGWAVIMAVPSILISPGRLPLALITGTVVSVLAIGFSAISRSAFAPRLVLLILWYGYLSAG